MNENNIRNTNYVIVKTLKSEELIIELQNYENNIIVESDKHISITEGTIVRVDESLNKLKTIKTKNNFIYNTFDCFFSDDEDIAKIKEKYGNRLKQDNNEDSRNKFDTSIMKEEFEYLNDVKIDLSIEIKPLKNEENNNKAHQCDEAQIKPKEQEKDHKHDSLLNINAVRFKKINTTSYNLREEIKNNTFYDYPGFDILDVSQPKVRTPKGNIMKKAKLDEAIIILPEEYKMI